MNREELQKVHDALSLLNSMVNCGDQHSPTSVNMTQAAFAILRKPLPPAEGAENIRQLLLGWEHYKRDHFRESEALDVEAILLSEYSQIAAQQQPTAELQSLMNDIAKWSDKTFGDGQRNPAIVYHLKKEVDELIAVFEGNQRNTHRQLWFEYADCIMLLLDSAFHAGFTAKDLVDAAREKLEINKARKCGKPDANGVVEHIKQPTAEGAEAIPGNSFHLTWKDAQKYPPKEGGRYWCVVREVNDLGISYYQWNCAYNPNDTSRWKDNFVSQDVIWWTELPPMPNLQRQQQPTAEGAEEILTKHLGSLMPLKYGVKYNKTIDAMREFATLHAQRIADKMVEDELRKFVPPEENFPDFDESKKSDPSYCVEWGMLKQRNIERQIWNKAINNLKTREK